jgi:hypothetical protein
MIGLLPSPPMTDDLETIALRATVIAGKGYEDDYQVIWLMKASGVPSHSRSGRGTVLGKCTSST